MGSIEKQLIDFFKRMESWPDSMQMTLSLVAMGVAVIFAIFACSILVMLLPNG